MLAFVSSHNAFPFHLFIFASPTTIPASVNMLLPLPSPPPPCHLDQKSLGVSSALLSVVSSPNAFPRHLCIWAFPNHPFAHLCLYLLPLLPSPLPPCHLASSLSLKVCVVPYFLLFRLLTHFLGICVSKPSAKPFPRSPLYTLPSLFSPQHQA